MSTLLSAGFGGQSNLPYRSAMTNYVPNIKQLVVNYIRQSAGSNFIFETGLKVLNSLADGEKRLGDAIVGVVNYLDYLMNAENVPESDAVDRGIPQCIDGFIANIVLRSPVANGLDRTVIASLEQAQNNLQVAIQCVNRVIVPEIEKERRGVTQTFAGGLLNNTQQRRTDTNGFGGGFQQQGFGNAGGMNLNGGVLPAGNQGSLFSSSPTPAQGNGGGISLGSDVPVQPIQQPERQPLTYTTAPEIKTNQQNLVTYMNYADHKTYGILKPTLPSDSQRRVMQEATIDQAFAGVPNVKEYKKLGDETIRNDLVAGRSTSFSLQNLMLSYGQIDLTSTINHEAAAVLKLGRADLERLTFTGTLIQLFPETDEDGKVQEILDQYGTGMLTHGRLTTMLGELEKVLMPETMVLISRKISELATNYWRFTMGQLVGDFDNYYTGHEDATEHLRRTPNKGTELEAWMSFPALVVQNFIKMIPLIPVESATAAAVNGTAAAQPKPDVAMCFEVGYIRVPYYGVEMPIGIEGNKKADYGLVVRNATPGLYHLCTTLYEAYPQALHRVLVSNDGRMIEVIRPLLGETDRFFVREMKTLF